MNNTRMRAIESGLDSATRKVLDALPLQEPWSLQQIHKELARKQTPMERRFMDGSVFRIVEHGLAREVRPGHYLRVAPKPENEPMSKPTPTTAAAQRAVDPLQQLGGISSALREHGKQQSQFFNSIADQIDEAALAMDKQAEAGKKLKQLLQDIG